MISSYGAAMWAGVMFGIGALPPVVYLALLTDLPGEDWDGSSLQTLEPDDSAYARQPINLTNTPSGFTQDENGLIYNTGVLSFGPPSVDWGTISDFALTDDLTAGNLLLADAFLSDVPSSVGVPCVVDGQSLFFSLSVQVPSIEGD